MIEENKNAQKYPSPPISSSDIANMLKTKGIKFAPGPETKLKNEMDRVAKIEKQHKGQGPTPPKAHRHRLLHRRQVVVAAVLLQHLGYESFCNR